MAKKSDMYIANLAFLLNYDEGKTHDEIEYEIFKVAFQNIEEIHYDRSIGGNFRDLEQDPANVATMLWFMSNIVQSIYDVNEEKNFDPYIVIGHNDISITSDYSNDISSHLIEVEYRLLENLSDKGTVKI